MLFQDKNLLNIYEWVFYTKEILMNYPQLFKDKLGRTIYIIENEFQKIIYTFYGESNKIKVKYVYFRNNVYFDVFSKSGEVIFSTLEQESLRSTIEKKHDGTFSFIIHPIKKQLINKI